MTGKLQHRARKAAGGCVLALIPLIFASEARAEDTTQIALDLEYAASLNEARVGSGAGGSLRLGRRLEMPLISLTPEVGAGFHAFSGSRDAELYSGFVGARLGFGAIVEPAIFAHVGVGKLAGREPDTGPSFDVGLSLALTFLPLVDVGAHVAYANLFLDDGQNFDWLRAGLHAAVRF